VNWWPLALAGLGVLGQVRPARTQVLDTLRSTPPDTIRAPLPDTFPDTLRLTLGEAARIAAERSAIVAAAHYGTAGIRARRREVESAFWPQLSAYLDVGERTINLATFGFPSSLFPNIGPVIGPIRTIDLRGQLRQSIFDWSLIQGLRGAWAVVAGAGARFSAGVAGSADVVNASLRLSDARTAMVAALAGYEAARVALARAQGVARDLP
jgi:outer membrane protein TolC